MLSTIDLAFVLSLNVVCPSNIRRDVNLLETIEEPLKGYKSFRSFRLLSFCAYPCIPAEIIPRLSRGTESKVRIVEYSSFSPICSPVHLPVHLSNVTRSARCFAMAKVRLHNLFVLTGISRAGDLCSARECVSNERAGTTRSSLSRKTC